MGEKLELIKFVVSVPNSLAWTSYAPIRSILHVFIQTSDWAGTCISEGSGGNCPIAKQALRRPTTACKYAAASSTIDNRLAIVKTARPWKQEQPALYMRGNRFVAFHCQSVSLNNNMRYARVSADA